MLLIIDNMKNNLRFLSRHGRLFQNFQDHAEVEPPKTEVQPQRGSWHAIHGEILPQAPMSAIN